ncbi:hypothetical protein V6N13_063968 [Hibiscus sabdariffa]|uniref:Uncharacterized protein n=2 Tax=Hibiscus sabdariffa TaxID=183260 RepID=A0ABR2BCL2_9ROSI
MASCTNAIDKEVSIRDILMKIYPVTCIKVADLGCASGPNAFFPTCKVIETITRIYQQEHWESPELQVLLNDLPITTSMPYLHMFLLSMTGSS